MEAKEPGRGLARCEGESFRAYETSDIFTALRDAASDRYHPGAQIDRQRLGSRIGLMAKPHPFLCGECGASYLDAGDSCALRLERLLALDHSRQEPWGSRHGQAFAAYALQHPQSSATSLDVSWVILHAIYVAGQSPAQVFAMLRSANGNVPREWEGPVRPSRPVSLPKTTIADLGDFSAAAYPDQLDAWCSATLVAWGVDPTSARAAHGGRETFHAE